MGYREDVTDSFVHVYNRGTKKMPIFRKKSDLFRLFNSLYYFNTEQSMPENWIRDVIKEGGMSTLIWPSVWETRAPMVSILACTVLENHFHILLKEKIAGGISKFMHRISMGYSKFINEKYDESGGLFQGAYKSRCVDDDIDLRNLMVYIMVKNVFETYPEGLEKACREFDRAYTHAIAYPLTSLAEYTGHRKSAILDYDLLRELSEEPKLFKEFARECMQNRLEQLTNYDF
ncbi:MAG: transposase [bacterium]